MNDEATFIRMLKYMHQFSEPISSPALAKALQAKPGVVYNAMRRMHAEKLVHIAAYTLSPTARRVALWRLGAANDAPKPKPAELVVQSMRGAQS
jgi:Mn-dependent DtxR family transcriptional regulator